MKSLWDSSVPMLIFLSYNERMRSGTISNIALQALAIDEMSAG